MGAPDILGRLTAAGLEVVAAGDRLRVWPADRLTDELRALIRANKPALLARLVGHLPADEALEERAAIIAESCGIPQSEATERARAIARPIPLTDAERSTLERLAGAWGMDEQDKAVMFYQCERGGELADGSRLSPDQARTFWLAEAGTVH